MFTLYAPIAGTVALIPDAAGASLVVETNESVLVKAPTRGTVAVLESAALELVDLRGRRIRVTVSADGATVEPLVSLEEALGFDAPLFRWTPSATNTLRVEAVSLGNTDVMLNPAEGSRIEDGADWFSIGPFSCGA